MAKKSKVRLKPGASIGEPAAEDDKRFLAASFVRHPTIDALKDVVSSQSVLLGRTGSGKSAILWHLETTLDNVTRVDPKDIAFQYLGNSAIIRQVNELGVNLHTFYEYLWTHILTLHITRECLGVRSQAGLSGVLSLIKGLIWRDEKRGVAVDYLEKHANSFWLNVEQVSTEITNAITEKLAREAGLSVDVFKARVESGCDWKDEHKRVFKHRAQEVVSALQMRELKETINALAECMDDKRSYYVLIDDLDLEWAGGAETQYALIRALIESLKTFRRIPNLKIIVAMREDLYEATLRTTTDKHFQAEKQEGIIKRLRWSDALLANVVERRIQQLFRYEYTKQAVTLADVLPPSVSQVPLRAYLINQTLRRPRDIIAFVNQILVENEGEILPLPTRAITKAEPGYSSARLRALEDEWRSCHPLIKTYVNSIHGLDGPTSIETLGEDRLFALWYEVEDLGRKPIDDVERLAKSVYDRDKELRYKRLARALTVCLYKIGAVGVKLHATQGYTFCYEQRASLEEGEIGDDTRFIVHPMLTASLGCRPIATNAA